MLNRLSDLRQHSTTLAALSVKGLGAAASLLATFLIARSGGAEATGEYALAVATAMMVSVLALAGLDQITVRTIAGDLREGKEGYARSALSQASIFVAVASIIAAALMMIASPFATWIGLQPLALLLAACAVFAAPLQRMAVAGLRATGRTVVSQAFDGFFHSTLLVAFLWIAYLLQIRITSTQALLGYVASLAMGALTAWFVLLRVTAHWPHGGGRRYATSPIVTSWAILVASLIHVFTEWSVLAQVGAQLGIADVGALRVAMQFVAVIAMTLIAVETTVGADFAGDFRERDFKSARRRHRKSSLFMAMVAGPPAAVCLLVPEWLLGFFGTEFTVAADALRILAAAQLVNVLTGPVGSFLVMAGRERISLGLAVIGLAVAVICCLFLIPRFGIVGAALAFASAIVVRNIGSYIDMQRYLSRQGG